MKSLLYWLAIGSMLLCTLPQAQAQRNRNKVSTLSYDTALYNALEWRNIGPFRGGRSAAVTGVPNQPDLYYFGSTGGGVWRTQNAGRTWENISDGYFGGSIGAVAVSQWDPNVIYVGGGEKTVRGNVSYGYGMWKSVDAGQTWQAAGLPNSRHISRVRIHPKNPDIVFAAVMGDLFKPTSARGVYKSVNGGKTWKKVLFANENAGAVDLLLDPNNPRIIYASTWRIRRTPYSLSSGGKGSALWKSTDGGDTWQNISEAEGLPKGPLGIIGVAVSPANSQRVWAMVEAPEGGLFRSENGGQTWRRVNTSRALRQRAWYYTRVYADPQDANTVYVLNVRYHKSTDGGKTFTPYVAPHGDHHDLWIAPEDPNRMIIGDDGGAQVSLNGGSSWSEYTNQPTAQFYRVTTDNHFPYRIYAAQQDNSTVRIYHRSAGGSISENDWESTAGGESAHIAIKPDDNEVVVGGSYGGYLSLKNHRTGLNRIINVWPDNPMGHGAKDLKYRFQWNFPVFFSPHNPNKLYVASNFLHTSTDLGQSWQTISPDLTRNDTSRLGPSGGPITKDNTAVEYYCTIFAAAESPLKEGLLWVGSDDGLVHVSQDGGANWQNITPEGLPGWTMINSIEPSPFDAGAAYVAATSYKNGDYKPYLFKTSDYGKTWQKITNGIKSNHFTRVLRADPDRRGLLYAGTESGMYISFDDGASWKSFQLNLPTVPITDLALKDKNLIAATQGRSLWLIDDLSPLHQLSNEVSSSQAHLFRPLDSYRMGGYQAKNLKTSGTNRMNGVMVYYYLANELDSAQQLSITFLDQKDSVMQTYATNAKEKRYKIKPEKGMNLMNWDLRVPNAEKFDGLVLWGGGLSGPKVPPGTYKVRLSLGNQSFEQSFKVLKDPRSPSTQADLNAQFAFLMKVRDKLTETHQAIKNMRTAAKQLKGLKAKLNEDQQALADTISQVIKQISVVEKALYQTKNESAQDPLNFPIRLNNKLANVGSQVGSGDWPPTKQAEAFRVEVTAMIDAELAKWYAILNKQIPMINQMANAAKVNAVSLD